MGFKIFFNRDAVKVGALIEELSKVGDTVYKNGEILIWLDEGKSKSSLTRIFKKLGLKDYFLREITEDTIESETGFTYAWGKEHLNKLAVKKFEEEHQKELVQMQENIQKANQLLRDRIAEYNELLRQQKQEKEGVECQTKN